MRSNHATAWVSVFCLSLFNAKFSQGAEYTLQTQAALRQSYTSNLYLSPDSPKDIWGSDVDVRAIATATVPTWLMSGSARLDNWFFYPSSPGVDLDMQNQYLDARLAHFSERSRWELNGSFISDALLSSHADPDLGIVRTRLQRDSITITPSWSYQLTEYTGLSLSYSYTDSKYPTNSQNQGSGYPDSTIHSLSATANHRVNAKLSLNSAVSATTYISTSPTAYVTSEGSPIGLRTTNFGSSERSINYLNVNFGFKYALYNDIEVSFSGGGQLSQTITDTKIDTSLGQIFSVAPPIFLGAPFTMTVPPPQTTKSALQFGPLFNISASKKFDTSTVGLVYGHQISPSINGELYTSDRVSIDLNHEFSKILKGGLQLSYSSSSFPFPNGNSVDQRYIQAGADMSYTMMKDLVINASYYYQLRTLTGGNSQGSASDNTQDNHNLSISLRYDFEQLHY